MNLNKTFFLLLILFGVCVSCNDSKIEEERKKQQEVLNRWDDMKEDTEMMARAKGTLSQAKSHYEEASSISEFISGIGMNNTFGMSQLEMTAYYEMQRVNGYFNCMDYAEKYYNEGNYEECIKYCNNAIQSFSTARSAYIGHRGDLQKYQ